MNLGEEKVSHVTSHRITPALHMLPGGWVAIWDDRGVEWSGVVWRGRRKSVCAQTTASNFSAEC